MSDEIFSRIMKLECRIEQILALNGNCETAEIVRYRYAISAMFKAMV